MQKKVMETETLSPAQVYKNRVKAIADKLPDNYKQIVYSHYPQYNTPTGAQQLSNVKQLRSAHVQLTEILERIATGDLKLKS